MKHRRLVLILSIASMASMAAMAAMAAAAQLASGAAPPAAGEGDAAAGNWPTFRGLYASGTADGQDLPDRWDVESGSHVRWRTAIAGLAHSSPIVWGHRVFVTTALSRRPEATFRHGLYGDGTASDDRSVHRFQVCAVDKGSGDVLWRRTVHEGVPKDKRHVKATYANSTPATDGRYVVAFFGSEGLFALDVEGELLWHKDLGRLDVGAYDVPSYEWGPASSPILDGDRVIVQCDTQGDSFLLAADLASGKTVWKVKRDELPSWGTPTLVPGPRRRELVTNGSNFIRGYDPSTGEELWRLGGSSKITAPTPIWAEDLIIVASGRHPEKPIFAVALGSKGDLTLPAGRSSSHQIRWSQRGRGPYMPTPIAYRGHLYVLANQGILDSYDLQTGQEIYRQRLRHGGGGFSASPVAADGKLYLSSEDGEILVVKAGGVFELLASNDMGERLMSTPAFSQGTLYVRGQHHLFAVGGGPRGDGD